MSDIVGAFNQRYQLGAPLGSGGMGTVFRAVDLETGQPVAVKVLRQDVQTTMPDAIERFLREAEALRRLNHPNIVKVLGSFDDEMHHCIVMEYVEGGTLYDLLRQKSRLSIKRTLEIALDLADALTRAHRLRIVHRDLKPANVLIADDGTPRLTDFGVAHMGARERVTATGTAIGTLDYMSPEALNSLPIDERADIWSFGVMLFEMLTGERPFHSANLTGVITAILTYPVPDLEAMRPDVPLPLVDLIYRMLVKDREGRLPSVRIVGAELEALLRDGDLPSINTTLTARRVTDSLTRPVEVERFQATTTPGSKPVHNLPAHTTPFVGRESELAEIRRLLGTPDVRLVTILGPGGMGKTRLAQQAAEMQVGTHQHGVFFVPLAQLREAGGVLGSLADSVGYVFQPGERSPQAQLLDYLREKQMLLLFDNFEHVIDGASLVSDILEAAPYIKVIATSRERLNLSAETIFALSGMDFPAWETPEDAMQYSAVQLFLNGARRAQPGFELTAGMLPSVARICRLVEGMPLGILLAAGWVETLTPREIAEEIGQSLDFLESDLRDLPERHRSLRAVFEYSWRLLTEAEQETFARLTAFQGGFEREAARRVAGATLRTLTNLVNKSLMRRDLTTGRYAIHPQVYQYAREHFARLPGGGSEITRLHAEYFAELAASLRPVLNTLEAPTAVAVLEDEIENIHLAWDWAIAQAAWPLLDSMLDTLTAFALENSRASAVAARFDALGQGLEARGLTQDSFYWRLRVRQARLIEQTGDYNGAARWSNAAYAYFGPRGDKNEVARALATRAYTHLMQGRYEDAKRDAREARMLAEEVRNGLILQVAVGHLGYAEFLQGNFDEAMRLYQSYIGETRKTSRLGEAYGLNNMGEILQAKGELAAAAQHFEQAYALFKDLRNRRGMAFSLNNLAGIYTFRGQYQEALAAFREAHDLNREIGDRNGIGHSLSALGNGAMYMGDMAEAINLYGQALAIRREIGDRRGEADSLNDLADAALMSERYDDAERYYLETLAIRREIGDQVGYTESLAWTGVLYAVGKADLPMSMRYLDEALAQAEQLGVPYLTGLVLVSYGETNFMTGHIEEARAQFMRALRLVIDTDLRALVAFSVIGLAGVYARSESLEDRAFALELVGMGLGMPRTMINFYMDHKLHELKAELHASLPVEVAEAALARGEARQLMPTALEFMARAG